MPSNGPDTRSHWGTLYYGYAWCNARRCPPYSRIIGSDVAKNFRFVGEIFGHYYVLYYLLEEVALYSLFPAYMLRIYRLSSIYRRGHGYGVIWSPKISARISRNAYRCDVPSPELRWAMVFIVSYEAVYLRMLILHSFDIIYCSHILRTPTKQTSMSASHLKFTRPCLPARTAATRHQYTFWRFSVRRERACLSTFDMSYICFSFALGKLSAKFQIKTFFRMQPNCTRQKLERF